MKTNDVLGIGNALMDFLVEVEEAAFQEFSLNKGEFHLVGKEKIQEIFTQLENARQKIEIMPGGSTANTVRGIAFLGGKSQLCGKVGFDIHGDNYIQKLEEQGVSSRLNRHHAATGQALTFITPDHQRTFSVHLGAAVSLTTTDISEEDIADSKILHVEGYLLEGPARETVLQAFQFAKKHHTLISIDLADPGVIRRNKDLLQEVVKDYADLVFVNEAEAQEFTGMESSDAALELGKYSSIAIVKLGDKGSLICNSGALTYVPAFPVEPIDTTGAGDSYAAGFLYGYCQGWNAEQAGKLGSLLAAKIVGCKGVNFTKFDGEKIKQQANENA